jgi:hypothetical protein
MIPPIAEYWDEASNVFYDGAQDKFNKAGGVNCYIHAFTQSLADPKKAIGADLTKILQDNANYILFSVIDAETQKYFEQAFGYVKGYDIIWKKEDFDLVQVEKPLVPADAFARLRKGAFHAFIEARHYRGYSPMLKVPEVWLYPLPYPDKRIIEKKWGIDHKKAPPEIVAKAREIANDFDLFLKENEKHRFFSGIVIDIRELEYYEEFVRKTQVQGADLESLPEAVSSAVQEADAAEDAEVVDIDDFFGSPAEETHEDESTAGFKQILEEYGLNCLYKDKILVAFKKQDRVYFDINKAKKYVGDVSSYKTYVVSWNKVKKTANGKEIKIPMRGFIYVGVPAFKLGLENAEDCPFVEEIAERD